MHTKTRLELIIERMALTRAGNILEAAGASGYTVTPAIGGYGGGRRWRRGTDLSTARDMVVMIAISDSETIDAALTELHRLLENHIGVVNVSDVRVLRPDRF